MAAVQKKIEVRLSGGASNTDVSASLGGVMSSQKVIGQTASALSAITGVTIDFAYRNNAGVGVLAFSPASLAGKQITDLTVTRLVASSDILALYINSSPFNSPTGAGALVGAFSILNDVAIKINASAQPVTASVTGDVALSVMRIIADSPNVAFTCTGVDWTYDRYSLTQNTIQVANSDPAISAIKWHSASRAFGTPIEAISGEIVVQDAEGGSLVCTVVPASLPTGIVTENVTITSYANQTFPNILSSEMYYGNHDYACFYVKNEDTVAHEIVLFCHSQPTGHSTFSLGLDPVGSGNGSTTGVATTIANKNNAPAGVVFSSPSTGQTGLSTGLLAAGAAHAFWQKRSIVGGEYAATANSISQIGIVVI